MDAAEREQAARFLRLADRDRFRVGRVALRRCLARRLGADPATLRFQSERFGKPALASAGAPSFNLSHSGDWVLIAIADTGEIGIDVERVADSPPDLEDYRRAFSSAELERLANTPPARRATCLARLWTRKEAYLKAVGAGMSRAPERIRVDASAPGMLTIIDVNDSPPPGPWQLRDLSVDERHCGCLAWRGAAGTLAIWTETLLSSFGEDSVLV
ncbi:MAG: 4'-phosphopantetheinyl transferase superfamily protein [Burkholderiaceae bacterium]